jgi:hypothetical protein
MREQLGDALEADVLDQDLIEDLLVAAFMRHLEICSKGGTIGGEICRGDLAHQHV